MRPIAALNAGGREAEFGNAVIEPGRVAWGEGTRHVARKLVTFAAMTGLGDVDAFREAIIGASLELGQALGEDGVTMRAIATKLGTSATTLYTCFESKAAIMRELRMRGLLMLARADSGRVELRCEVVDLNKLCQQMVEYISPLAQQRDQMLTYESPNTALAINADLQRIKQMLLNLLDNAIKYTEPGGSVKLALKAENKHAVITVTDTGRGIPAEDLPHIFERFFRRSAKTSDRSAAGFGLGLSIVKWIVDSHGGQIETQSQQGQGTTFIVKFPLLD